jgi:hypothetical protein
LKLTDQNYAKVRKISQKYAKVCQWNDPCLPLNTWRSFCAPTYHINRLPVLHNDEKINFSSACKKTWKFSSF